MAISEDYTPPKVWVWDPGTAGPYASINRPTAGATHEKPLPVGRHPLQLYSLGTPNGQKVTIALEELLELGIVGADYDAWLIRIADGDQFGSGFVAINPNSKIPALVDRSGPAPVTIFESGAILLHLAEKFGALLPTDPAARGESLSWLFWQMASTPYLTGGGFGHFYAQAPVKIEYAINRYALETKRVLDVLNRRLADRPYLAGESYSIADIAIFPWFSPILKGAYFNSGEFLQVEEYGHARAWVDRVAARPGVQRGRKVNNLYAPDLADRLVERHDASDFLLRTEDKLQAGG